jgi:hypothetical protein
VNRTTTANGTTVEEARKILAEVEQRGATARVLGGLGVALRCPTAQGDSPLARRYGDLDLAITRDSASVVADVVEDAGYEPARRFNAAHGRTRLLFADADGRHLDVFIGTFTMCHVLPLDKRLTIHHQTLSLADLLLTKLQIARLNRKDVVDAAALMADHALSDDEDGINVEYVSRLLSEDWGWWRTVTENLRTLVDRGDEFELPSDVVERIRDTATRLTDAIDQRPKALKWKIRAKLGDRVPWRDDPEEVAAT